MSRIFAIRCDGSGCTNRTEATEGERLSGGWYQTRWVPGLVNNTERKPDKHFCSKACLDEYKKTKDL